MKIYDFNERLKDAILIADGAMGSMLHEAVGPQRCFDELNATEPEAVFRVHQAYIEAGAQIIETNTFGANRFKLAPLGLGDEVQRFNSRGVKIAREARESAAREVLIAGSIGPLGLGVQARHPDDKEILDVFYEQALALEERGVDFYILETFSYIEEILLAVDARAAAALGVRILGGCCGTTPAHIQAMAEAVKSLRPAKAHATSPVAVEAVAKPAAVSQREPESRFWKKLRKKEFTICVEIDPPKGLALDRIFEQVDKVMASRKIDAIDINSGAMARVGMDALVVAGALEARGVETIPHLTTRDQNIIGLQAALLGAWTVGGVRNVLAITGDPPSVGDYPETSGVYEVDSVGLVKVLSRLNQGTDWAGKTLGGATNFAIGVALNPVADDLDNEIARFHAKVEAGAHYAMTQPLFDPEHWHAFLKKLGDKPPIPILIGVWPLNSYKQALRLNNEVPGMVIPEALLKSWKLPELLRAIAASKLQGRCSLGRGASLPAPTSFHRSSVTKRFWKFYSHPKPVSGQNELL